MTTKVNICNVALVELGADTITSLEDDTKSSRQCNQVYDAERRKLLRTHPWNFAIGRQALPRLVTSPSFEYTYEYTLPSDCLRALKLYNSNERFSVEGQKLLTNEAAPKLIYIKDVTDPQLFDATFADLLSLSIALRICYSMTGSNSLSATLMQKIRKVFVDTKQYDGQEGNSYQFPAGEWLDNFFDF